MLFLNPKTWCKCNLKALKALLMLELTNTWIKQVMEGNKYCMFWHTHNEKKGVLQLALQLNFLIIEDICNSLYLYIVTANEQVA